MKLSRMEIITLAIIITLGTGVAVLGYTGQLAFVLMLSVVLTALWCAAVVFGKPDLHLVFFVAFLALIGISVFNQQPYVWTTLAICFDIAAWNLGEFSLRLGRYEHIHNPRKLENLHFKQLGIVLGIGFLLAMVPALIQFEMSFVLIVVLVLGAVVLIGVGIHGLREKDEAD